MERREAVRDLLNMAAAMSGVSYFYLTEDLENEDYVPPPVCPEIISERIMSFLTSGVIRTEIARDREANRTIWDGGSMIHFVIEFGIHFLVVQPLAGEGYAVMGPLRYKKPDKEEMRLYAEKYHLSRQSRFAVEQFLNVITNEHAMGEPLRYIICHLYGIQIGDLIHHPEVRRVILEDVQTDCTGKDPWEQTNLRGIDEQYERERLLRTMVVQGRRREAGVVLENWSEPRYLANSADNCRLHLFYLNILYKQAMLEAGFPAASVEHLYRSYFRAISGDITSLAEKWKMYSGQMLDDYCSLARDYTTGDVSKRSKKVMNYVMLHYTEPISVKEIADYMKLTPNYLSSSFKKETGMSLMDYINDIRVNASLTFLTNTDMPVSQVAGEVGFSDYNYFSRVFKKRLNVSPSKYRQDSAKTRG